ncbi:MAG: DinB family protein [Chloroflexota bacterium]|nr:DinB family protein [Chloroflexota bacterium]
MSPTTSIAPFYEGWHLANDTLIAALEHLTPEQLALPVGSPTWPIWASVSHLAGTRVYWLCHIFKEPGAQTTPFNDPSGFGWEDDLTHPRDAAELVGALRSTWSIVERTLATWTPESLTQEARRQGQGFVQVHTRQSVLWRMITHDAFHSGEISLALGSNGIGAIDPWRGLSRRE